MSDIFTSKRRKLKKRAGMLLPAAQMAGVSSYTLLLDKLPAFNSVSTKHWDFFFPIAAVFVAIAVLEETEKSAELKAEVGAICGRALSEWSTEWSRAFADCGEFVSRTGDALLQSNDPEYAQSSAYLGSDPVGLWLVWNLLGYAPQTAEERKLTRALGLLVTEGFANWWT